MVQNIFLNILAREMKRAVEHEAQDNTNCSWSARNGSQ